jgi:Arm DNA-binding domain
MGGHLKCICFPTRRYLFDIEVARTGREEGERMPRLKFTKSAIDALPIAGKDTVYWDSAAPGFGVKVTPKGRKVFIVLYRVAGRGSRLRKYTLGPTAG